MGETNLNKRFIILVLIFITSISILIFSPSIIGIIIGWDGLGITSFLLVIFYQNISRIKSGLVTIYINRFGDVIIIFIIIISINSLPNKNIFIIKNITIIFILLAAITKRAQIPFSAWLPIAIAAPTPVSSLVHSSTLVTAGVYILLRFSLKFKEYNISIFLLLISLITRISARFIACVESDFKKIIAISTLSQLGIIIIILSINHRKISFFHIIRHALFKALLFLSCGIIIIISSGIQDRRFKGGINTNNFFTPLLFSTSRISLIGFPFLTGFFSKDFIIERTNEKSHLIIFIIIILTCVITSIYRFRLYFVRIKNIRSNERNVTLIEI